MLQKLLVRVEMQCNIPYNKISSFVTDNVNYMTAAYVIVKTLCQNCTHIGCWANIFSLVGDCWRNSFADVDKFVAAMKKLFNLSRKKKRIYIEILKENGVVNPKHPPMPVVTRWSSWLEAVQQHSDYFQFYPALADKLEEIGEDTMAFETVQEILQDSYEEMKLKLRFISTLSTKVCDAVKLMEGRRMGAHKIYNYAQEILLWLVALEKEDFLVNKKLTTNNYVKVFVIF